MCRWQAHEYSDPDRHESVPRLGGRILNARLACGHWSNVGDIRATDREIMDWALANDHVVFTHDLDFGTMLALTHDSGPSVFQIRGQKILPDHMSKIVVAALRQHEADLAAGALVVVDEAKSRVRVLPI